VGFLAVAFFFLLVMATVVFFFLSAMAECVVL